MTNRDPVDSADLDYQLEIEKRERNYSEAKRIAESLWRAEEAERSVSEILDAITIPRSAVREIAIIRSIVSKESPYPEEVKRFYSSVLGSLLSAFEECLISAVLVDPEFEDYFK